MADAPVLAGRLGAIDMERRTPQKACMSIRDEMMKRGLQAMSDPRMAKLLQNPQVMKVLMALMQVPGKLNTFTNEQARVLASALRLATAEDVKELARAVQRLERELARLSDRGSADR
jgi:hypothetical protein